MNDIELVRHALASKEPARLAFERHLERDADMRKQLSYIRDLLRSRKYGRIDHIVQGLIQEE